MPRIKFVTLSTNQRPDTRLFTSEKQSYNQSESRYNFFFHYSEENPAESEFAPHCTQPTTTDLAAVTKWLLDSQS